jgi:hypothetical protein
MPPEVIFVSDFLTFSTVQHPSCTGERRLVAHPVESDIHSQRNTAYNVVGC